MFATCLICLPHNSSNGFKYVKRNYINGLKEGQGLGNGGLAESSNLFLNGLSHFPWNRSILEIKNGFSYNRPASYGTSGDDCFLGPRLSTMPTLAIFSQ